VVIGVSRQYIANIAKVRSKGVEGDFRFAPSDRFAFNASASYTDAKYVTYTNAPLARRSIRCVRSANPRCSRPSGEQLPACRSSPTRCGADGNLPVAGVSVDSHLDWSYPVKLQQSSSNSKLAEIKGYGLIDARLGLRAQSGLWDLAIWAKNLLDEDYVLSLEPRRDGRGDRTGGRTAHLRRHPALAVLRREAGTVTLHALHSATTVPASGIGLLHLAALALQRAGDPALRGGAAGHGLCAGAAFAPLRRAARDAGAAVPCGPGDRFAVDPRWSARSAIARRAASARRQAVIFGGGVLFVLGSAILFFPPAGVSAARVGLGGDALLLRGLRALHAADGLVGEIGGDYDERTRIGLARRRCFPPARWCWRWFCPRLPTSCVPASGQAAADAVRHAGPRNGVPGLWLTLTAVPDDTPPALERGPSPRAALNAVLGNPLLLRVLAADAAVTAGQGVRTGLLLFVVTFALGRPEWAAGMFLFQYSFGILAAPIWSHVGKALGKAQGAVLAELVQAAINFGLLFLSADRFWLMLLLAALQGLGQGSGNLMLRSIVSDIADHHRLATGEDRTGLYFSVFGISIKLGGALAVGIALPLVAWLGFDPKARRHAGSAALADRWCSPSAPRSLIPPQPL
jgi:hypothetical protein